MPRRKIVRTRKNPDNRLAELIKQGRQIQETFFQRRSELAADMKQSHADFCQRMSKKFCLPVEVIREWLASADGSTLKQLAAKYQPGLQIQRNLDIVKAL